MIVRPLQQSSRVMRSPGYLEEEIDGQIVLLGVEAGNYYGLDEIGSEIWRALEKETSVAELCEILVARYDAPPDVVERDAVAFLNHLLEHRLISAA